MFQRTLILAAISAAFPELIPIVPCDQITRKLQTAFHPKDPHTFPTISDFIYIRDNVRYNFDFTNLMFRGFSNVICRSSSGKAQGATLNLTGQDLVFDTGDAIIYINPPIRTRFNLQLRDYALELWFRYTYYSPYPFSLCITGDSLHMNFSAERIRTNILFNPQEALVPNTDAVVRAINNYLPRLANFITTILNKILCHY
ncbi:uncharacterized protein [Palaemon carinicauda]|uniref:uncharacterized protein n=1 Tax=Palaemon carinicauda TaxID=392227 RepID=UPI0035B5893B